MLEKAYPGPSIIIRKMNVKKRYETRRKTGCCIQMKRKMKKLVKNTCQSPLNVVLYVSAKR